MGNTETWELGRIQVDLPVEYRSIKELHITDRANAYGTLVLSLILPETTEDNVAERLEGQNIRILTSQREGIFAGICTSVGLTRENRYAELHLEAESHACVTDMEPKKRTFQSPEKTLQQVAELVLADYPVSLQVEKDIIIEQMLSQQRQTGISLGG